MLSSLVIAGWIGLTALKGVLAVTLFRRRLAAAYPFLTLFAAWGFVRFAWLGSRWYAEGFAGYRDGWRFTEGLNFAVVTLLAVAAFWRLVSSLPRFVWFGSVLMILFGAVSTSISLAMWGVGAADHPLIVEELVHLSRHFAIGAFVFVGLSVIFCWSLQSWEFVRPNARIHSLILLLFFGGEVVASSIERGFGGSYAAVAVYQVIRTLIPVTCVLLWMSTIRPEGEKVQAVRRIGRAEYESGILASVTRLRHSLRATGE